MAKVCFAKEVLYSQYLAQINSIKFTIREIDIISCILHNRTNKKIASILSISNRTVESHIYNVVSKLNKSSKDDIIDFIGKCGKLTYIREYYMCLLARASFEKYIAKVYSINKSILTYSVIDNNIQQDYKKQVSDTLNQLEKDIKLANIIRNDKVKYLNFYIETNVNNIQKNNGITLLFGDSNTVLKPRGIIDFTDNQDYYLGVFDLLKRIITKSEIDAIQEGFYNEYQSILLTNTDINRSIERGKNTVILKTLCIFIFLSALAYTLYYFAHKQSTDINYNTLSYFIHQGLSNKYITKEDISNNYNIIIKVKNEIDHINFDNIYDQLGLIESKELLILLYNIHALSNYYMYNEHDYVKARRILLYVKHIIEVYINTKNKIKVDFPNLDNSNILTELGILNNLPEIYTRAIYSLARTYIYQPHSPKTQGYIDARKYFELSRYLGDKLGLFEGYLSMINGLLIIDQEDIKHYINIGHYDKAVSIIYKNIETYQNLKNDSRKYKDNYQSKDNYITIIPKDNDYTQIACSEYILRLYKYLLNIQTNLQRNIVLLDKIIDDISREFIGDTEVNGLIKFINNVPGKKKASIYNLIGEILLIAYDNNIDTLELKKAIMIQLNVVSEDMLEIIYQIFKFAEVNSRSTEFTKADSYDGLIEVYKRKVNNELDETKQQEIRAIINNIAKERDKINNTLNRIR